ncbi:hypothetical protein [Pendulispora albinea]|uniref:Lipoprotein n=1 Tax=Pendulispora albinea TaxID=2741071 RepID=A0ABZ2M4Y6_9BACT
MMKATTSLMAALILAIAGCASSSPDPLAETTTPQESRAVAAARDQAAHASLETLRQVMDNQKTVGPVAEPASAGLVGARVGDGVPMRMVRLDALRAYRPGDDPRGLLVDRGAFMYPVTVGGDPRTSVVMALRDGQWVPSRFGGVHSIKALHATQRELAAARPLKNLVLVDVPALHAKFLGRDEEGELVLTPLQDIDDTKLLAGRSEKAADVFEALVPLAREVDIHPPQ